jgi:hypothetical protein
VDCVRQSLDAARFHRDCVVRFGAVEDRLVVAFRPVELTRSFGHGVRLVEDDLQFRVDAFGYLGDGPGNRPTPS